MIAGKCKVEAGKFQRVRVSCQDLREHFPYQIIEKALMNISISNQSNIKEAQKYIHYAIADIITHLF